MLSIAVRVLFWRWYGDSGAVPPGDPEEYYRAALHILRGGYHDTGRWLRPPGYPALLALLLALAGMDVARALLFQAALLGAGALAFYALGRQLFGVRAGLLSALVAALYVPLAAFGPAMYAEALFVTLLVLGLAALDRAHVSGRRRWALVAGALLGAATLTRAVALFFLPLAALWLLYEPRRHEGTKKGRAFVPSCLRGEKRYLSAAALLLGAALLIAPWTARNYAAHQRLILVDTNGGISMWWGVVRSPEEKAAGDEALFAVPNLADRQALALRWTAERVLEDPAAFLARARFKLASLFMLQARSYAAGDVIAVSPAGEAVVQNAGELALRATLLADAQYIAVMLLGIAGVCMAPAPRRALPALLWVAVAAGLAALTIGHPRLRLPIVAALVPFCAYALLRIWTAVRVWGPAAPRRKAFAEGLRPSAPPLRSGETPAPERQPLSETRSLSAHPQQGRGPAAPDHEPAAEARGPCAPSRRVGPARRVGAALAGCLLFLALIASTRYVAWTKGEWHAHAARQQLLAEDYRGARESLEQARATDPANALRTVALADLELRTGDLAAADGLYRAALELEGRNLYSRAMRVLLAPALGQPQVAREELAAFDAYWRARDDLHQWAWRHAVAAPPARLVPGDGAALGHFAGFAPATEDLPQGRWTLGAGRVRLPGTCGAVTLRVQGPSGRDAEFELEGSGRLARVALDGAAQDVRLALGGVPGCGERDAVVIVIRSATGLLDIERAPWYVGVAVLEARVEP